MNSFQFINDMKNVDHWSDKYLNDTRECLVSYLKDKINNDKTFYFYKRLEMIEKEIHYRQVLTLN